MPRYRFTSLLNLAFELCRELKEMESQALSVKERRDTEAFAALNAKHCTAAYSLVMQVKRAWMAEGLAAIEALEETRRSHEARLAFYLTLTGDAEPAVANDSSPQEISQAIGKPTSDDLRMSPSEQKEYGSAVTSMTSGKSGNELEHVAAILDAFPGIYLNIEPWGVGMSIEAGPAIIARAMRIGVTEHNGNAQAAAEESRLAGMTAQLNRQLQERREFANEAVRDIKIVDRMIAAAKARVVSCEKDIQQQQQQQEAAAEVDEWLRSKYTSEQLYAWMDKQYGMIFQRTYLLASEMARQVQRAFFFERPTEGEAFLLGGGRGYWDSARDGMLCAENLWMDLKRMEMAYLNKRGHDFELVKVISLRRVDPLALLLLRETGHAQFSLPEVSPTDAHTRPFLGRIT
jgi:hypothetical protein